MLLNTYVLHLWARCQIFIFVCWIFQVISCQAFLCVVQHVPSALKRLHVTLPLVDSLYDKACMCGTAGKSLQVITFLHTLHALPEDGKAPVEEDARTLLVAPANVLANWQDEFARWLPPPPQDSQKNNDRLLTKDKVSVIFLHVIMHGNERANATRNEALPLKLRCLDCEGSGRGMGQRVWGGECGPACIPCSGNDSDLCLAGLQI